MGNSFMFTIFELTTFTATYKVQTLFLTDINSTLVVVVSTTVLQRRSKLNHDSFSEC